MLISIGGYRSQNKKLKMLLEKAASFYGTKLMSRRLYNNIELSIVLTRKMKKKEGCYGTCHFEDNEWRPREFMIELDGGPRRSLEMLLMTLAHEMIHLKQWARGEMQDYARKPAMRRWKSKTYDVRKIDYADEPWEKEAYRLEEKLYKEFAEVVL